MNYWTIFVTIFLKTIGPYKMKYVLITACIILNVLLNDIANC